MRGKGERQVAPQMHMIRSDHRFRYRLAASRLGGQRVLDAGCGIGYGSTILAEAGCEVTAYDKSPDAIRYAQEYYNSKPNIDYKIGDVYQPIVQADFDAVVAFEVLEHLTHPHEALYQWRETGAKTLLVSVPNEEVFPYRGRIEHHVRHYTKDQLGELLEQNGWTPKEWWGQEGVESDAEPDLNGRTLICLAERNERKEVILPVRKTDDEMLESLRLPGRDLPESVAIIAMGNSVQYYYRECIMSGGARNFADEVWAINMLAGVIQADRVIHMDDIKIQEARRDIAPTANDKRKWSGMLDSFKEKSTPVYTSRAYPDYPATVEYPLEWVCNKLQTYYMNSTVSAAICLALAMGVKELKLYGADFAYPGDTHRRERGRACCEFWLGWAARNGIRLHLPPVTNLLDYDVPEYEKYYGYDTEWITMNVQDDGSFRVGRVDRDPKDIPSPVEMDRRYSHDVRRDSPSKH